MVVSAPRLSTAPVLAVLVCHNGESWLPEVLDSVRGLTVGPRHLLAVDTGSTDRTAELLSGAREGDDPLLDGVLTLPEETGFGTAVAEAVEQATERWGDPGRWLWLVHDDSAPEPDCLENLLGVADLDSTAAMLGPLGLDWADPRWVVDAGLSLDAAGNRQTGVGQSELDPELGAEGGSAAGSEWTNAESAASGTDDSATDDAATDDAATDDSATDDSATDDSATGSSETDDSAGSESDGSGTGSSEPGTGGDSEVSENPQRVATSTPSANSGMAVSEVLAVSTACALVRRDVFDRISGFDEALPLAADDLDLGWRINTDGHPVLCVPGARMRHAGALRAGERDFPPLAEKGLRTLRAADRAHGVRTFLTNAPWASFVLGVPRLFGLAVLRMLGFLLLRRLPEASAEFGVLGRFVTGRMGLLAARAARRSAVPVPHGVRGLLTSRLTRIRNGLRGAFVGLVRDRVRREVVLGHRPAEELVAVPAAPLRPVGRDALPAGALNKTENRRRSVAGLRRPSAAVVVPMEAPAVETPEQSSRPSPVPRGEPAQGERLLLIPVDRWRIVRELLLAPPVLLTVALIAFALISNGLVAEFTRFGGGLHGGRLLPVSGLGQTWSDYVNAWHAVNGGTGSPAPASLLVLAITGTVLAPLGGPPAVVALVLLFGVPLAGLSAYRASRALPVSGTWRAVAAGAYALFPAATLSAGQGRLDVVVAHVLVPVLLAGIASVIGFSRLTSVLPKSGHWLGTACLTALGLAVLGAFAPAIHAALIVLAVLGFVLVPSEARSAPRRVAGLAAIVLLPVACLLPWPVVLVENPQILLHGLGARLSEAPAGAWLIALSPDGSIASWAGALFVLAAVGALVMARGRGMILGLVVSGVGWATAVLVAVLRAEPIGGGPSTPGWTGAPLVLVTAGLTWVVLSARRWAVPKRSGAVLVVLLLALGASAAIAGRGGPLTSENGETTPAMAADLAGPGTLLDIEPGGQPGRLVDGERPRFGDDDLVPVGTAVDWLRRVDADLLSGDRDRVHNALAAAAARGVGFIAVPEPTAEALLSVAGDHVVDHGHLAHGDRALRILLPTSEVELLGPDLARKARAEEAPSPQARPLTVSAELPHVGVRVSEGGSGRVLVLGAENEPGWQATIDGRAAPLASVWGHQVGVPLPEQASEVRVTYTEIPRTSLLVVQAAAILFTLIGALPERRRTRTGAPLR